MPSQQVEHVPLLAPAVLRRFFPAFVPAALVVFGIVTTIYRQDLSHQRHLLEQQSEHVAALHEELLLFEFRSVQSDLLYLAAQQLLKDYLAGDAALQQDVEREYVSFALNKGHYDQIRCLDAAGHEIVRVNYRDAGAQIVAGEDLQSKAARYYYQQAMSLGEGEVFVSPFDLNVEHGQIEQPIRPVIRFVTPVFDDAGERRGFLVLNYLGARLLNRLQQNTYGFRGDILLINSRGEYVQAHDRSREWGWLLGHDRSFRDDHPDVWNSGVRPDAGQLSSGGDLFTFRRVSPHRSGRERQSQLVDSVSDDPAALIVVAHVTVATAIAHSRDLLKQLLLVCACVTPILIALLLYWARAGELRKSHQRQILDSEVRLRQLSSLLLTAQETERRTVSRDLHDELGQQVTAISLDLRSLAKENSGLTDSPLLQRAIRQTDRLLRSVHEIATRLRPSVLDDLGLQEAAESLIAEFQERHGIRVRARLNPEPHNITQTVGASVYRILQEALANVASHAQADDVEVTMETDDRALKMSIRDSGIGFDPSQQGSEKRLGILGMRERVELLDGRFALTSTPGGGTHIRVEIPTGDGES